MRRIVKAVLVKRITDNGHWEIEDSILIGKQYRVFVPPMKIKYYNKDQNTLVKAYFVEDADLLGQFLPMEILRINYGRK